MSTSRQPNVERCYEETAHNELILQEDLRILQEDLREIHGKDPDYNVPAGKEFISIPEAINDLEKSTIRSDSIRKSVGNTTEY